MSAKVGSSLVTDLLETLGQQYGVGTGLGPRLGSNHVAAEREA